MARAKGDIIEGRDLMVFIKEGSNEIAQAAATSHTITYSGETKTRLTKDTANGAYDTKAVTKLSVSIKCDALVSYSGGTSGANDPYGYDKLLKSFKNREVVKLKYGFADKTDKYEEGNFVITSLEQTSAAGEDATYSATFENSGEVTTA